MNDKILKTMENGQVKFYKLSELREFKRLNSIKNKEYKKRMQESKEGKRNKFIKNAVKNLIGIS